MRKKINNDSSSGYKRFIEVGSRVSDSYLTITNGATIQFNAGFVHQHFEYFEGSTHVILGYSGKDHCFGIEFIDSGEKDGAIKISGKGRSKAVSFRSFLNFNHIDLKKVKGRHYPILKFLPEIKAHAFIVQLPRDN